MTTDPNQIALPFPAHNPVLEPLPDDFEDDTPISVIRAHILEHRLDGLACPACGQFAKEYKRKLNSTMVRGLIWLVQAAGPDLDWIHVQTKGPHWLVSKGGCLATTAHWKLAERRPVDPREGKRASGIWRPTRLGSDFVHLRAQVPSHVYLYDNVVQGFSTEQIGVVEALGKHFNYHELMAAR